MKRTHQKTKTNLTATIAGIIFLIGLIIFAVWQIIYRLVTPAPAEELAAMEHYLLILLFGFLAIFAGSGLIASLTGILRGRRAGLAIPRHIKHNNPLQYFKELPNPYGIGVATILLDSHIENEKDIIAAILDLCAKGYLKLKYRTENGYTIKVLTHDLSGLLQNERYLIQKIADNQIASIDYDEWYAYCVEDSIGLGLLSQHERHHQNTDPAKTGVLATTHRLAYEAKLAEYLKPTTRGIQELQKLYAFRDFLKDFGNFDITNEEEVILWEYYLSYATVFGLANDVLKTGYSRLVKNSSFEIDDFSAIRLKSIYTVDTLSPNNAPASTGVTDKN